MSGPGVAIITAAAHSSATLTGWGSAMLLGCRGRRAVRDGGGVMRSTKRRRIFEAVQPHLLPREEVRLITQAGVGGVSIKRQIGVGVAVAVVSLGHLSAIAQPRTFVLIVTDRRLLFIDPSAVHRDGIATIALALPLSGLSTEPYRGPSLTKRFDLVAEGIPPLRLDFPLSGRADAEAIREAVEGL